MLDLLALDLYIANSNMSVKTLKSSATHGTINIVVNRQMAVDGGYAIGKAGRL